MRKFVAASEEQVAAFQRPVTRTALSNSLFGRAEPHVTTRDERVPGEAGDLLLRLHIPSAPSSDSPALLFMHGGGWVMGDVGMTDWWCSHFAERTGTLVASLGYRLAPQTRFPGALNDGYRALRWLADHATELDLDPTRISVGGDSAGGNLAAALCLLARERHRGPQLAGQILIYPALDLTERAASMRTPADDPILQPDAMRAFRRHYLGPAGSPDEPLVSPLVSEDVSGLPPALIQVAEHDPLRDDGWHYALRLQSAGVPVSITEYAGAPHGFVSFPGLTRLARRALDEACDWQSAPIWTDLATDDPRDRGRDFEDRASNTPRRLRRAGQPSVPTQ